eukprot:10797829-Alexandrium_andersonii.AAC.1
MRPPALAFAAASPSRAPAVRVFLRRLGALRGHCAEHAGEIELVVDVLAAHLHSGAPGVRGERAPAECQKGRLSGPIAMLLRSLSGVGAA